jgi:hypothetical protein
MTKQVVGILDRTLKFDPRSRNTVDEILEDEFFASCRKKEL